MIENKKNNLKKPEKIFLRINENKIELRTKRISEL